MPDKHQVILISKFSALNHHSCVDQRLKLLKECLGIQSSVHLYVIFFFLLAFWPHSTRCMLFNGHMALGASVIEPLPGSPPESRASAMNFLRCVRRRWKGHVLLWVSLVTIPRSRFVLTQEQSLVFQAAENAQILIRLWIHALGSSSHQCVLYAETFEIYVSLLINASFCTLRLLEYHCDHRFCFTQPCFCSHSAYDHSACIHSPLLQQLQREVNLWRNQICLVWVDTGKQHR